jgi:PKHD-type hydroxylase
MLIQIPDVLTQDQVRKARALLNEAGWTDGKITAGHQSAKAKDNDQLPDSDPAARKVGEMILKALEQTPLFLTAALPRTVFPPLFNRYRANQSFGTHIDNAIRQIPNTPIRIRTDLSATLFLSEPSEYEGGELVIETNFGLQTVKLKAGDMVLYPASSLHHVRPTTEGTRLASFFWIQSLIRDDTLRSTLFDMDLALQRLARDCPDHPSIIQLTGVYHNLLRLNAEV